MIYAQSPAKESKPVQCDADGKLLVSDTTSTGTKVTTVTALEAGGSGIIGWLSQVWRDLVAMSAKLPATLGIKTAAASLSVVPASDADFLVHTGQVASATATIANAASLSGAVNLGLARAVRIAMPAAWTTANLTFQTSVDGATYNDLYDKDGTEYTAVAAASRSIILPFADFLGIRYLKVRSGTSAAAVNQGGERVLTIQTVA